MMYRRIEPASSLKYVRFTPLFALKNMLSSKLRGRCPGYMRLMLIMPLANHQRLRRERLWVWRTDEELPFALVIMARSRLPQESTCHVASNVSVLTGTELEVHRYRHVVERLRLEIRRCRPDL